MVIQLMKHELGLPSWVAICAGAVAGRFLRVKALEDLWKQTLPKDGVIAFCDVASGEEEVPPGCKGVVVNRDLPVLSHLAVRARQMGVTFVCTSEDALFQQQLQFADGVPVKLTVSSNGDTQVVEVAPEALFVNKLIDGSIPASPAELGRLNLKETAVLPVTEVKRATPETVGAKASSAGLLEALAAEKVQDGAFSTPISCAIPFGVMSERVNGKAFDTALAALEEALASSKAVEKHAKDVREVVASLHVPPAVLQAVTAAFPKEVVEVAVRSSANSEDLANVSGAGLHDSVLGVALRGQDDLERAILQVWGSLFTLRAVQSRHSAGMPLYKGISMGVLVQQMAVSALRGAELLAFIMFSEHVTANDSDQVYIEMCVGLGETLASASVPGTPYRISVQKQHPHAVKVISLGSFSHAIKLSDTPGKGPEDVLIDYSCIRLSSDFAYLEALARRLAKVALRVEKSYGVGMDMEGVVVENADEQKVFLVQARPIVKATAGDYVEAQKPVPVNAEADAASTKVTAPDAKAKPAVDSVKAPKPNPVSAEADAASTKVIEPDAKQVKKGKKDKP
jgi:phosphoglucan,water dikinase